MSYLFYGFGVAANGNLWKVRAVAELSKRFHGNHWNLKEFSRAFGGLYKYGNVLPPGIRFERSCELVIEQLFNLTQRSFAVVSFAVFTFGYLTPKMSLLPLLSASLSDPWRRDYPSRTFDRPVSMGLLDSVSDLLSPTSLLMRPLLNADTALSNVKNETDKFKVMLNVSQFKPNEIDVKTVDNNIVIHGKHEEKTDEHGFVSREFTRRYMLPEGADPKSVKSSLSANGILTIEAPKKVIEPPPSNERIVPITMERPAGAANK